MWICSESKTLLKEYLNFPISPSNVSLWIISSCHDLLWIINIQQNGWKRKSGFAAGADNQQKIVTSLNSFEKYVDVEALSDKLITYKGTNVLTPRMFQYNLLKDNDVIMKNALFKKL